jgi:hypothetical protein
MDTKRLTALGGCAVALALAVLLLLRILRGKPSLDSASRDELYERAKKLNIRGRSKMSKQELQTAVEAELD